MPKDSCIQCKEHHVNSLLHSPGTAVIPLPGHAKASFTTALKAFEGQLKSWTKLNPAEPYTGFETLPQKSRMQFRPGDANLGDIGVLQEMALEVVVRTKTTS